MRRVVFKRIAELVTASGHRRPAAGPRQGEAGIVRRAFLCIEGERIRDLGPMDRYDPGMEEGAQVVDARGWTLTPGFVDAHTHACFAGWQAERLLGSAAPRGGALRAAREDTVRRTRQVSEEYLAARTRRFLDAFLNAGTTTAEIKSGYGLEPREELKQLRAIASAAQGHPVQVVATCLAASTIPPEYRGRRTAFLKRVERELLPEVAASRLARFCDVACHPGALQPEEALPLLEQARRLGLGLRVHADALGPGGGAALAARAGAASADHLAYADPRELALLAEAGTVAVLLPGAYLFAGSPWPPARFLIDRLQVPVALGSDFSPDGCHLYSMRWVMALACLQLGMTPGEALVAATLNAAFVLGVADRAGSLEPGKRADFLVWDCPSHLHLVYRPDAPLLKAVYAGGQQVAGGEGNPEPAAAGPLPPELVRFIRLFLAGHYFAAHEVLEEAWRACRSPFYHGLILVAAGYEKLQRGNREGARRHFLKALQYLEPLPSPYLGLDLEELRRHLRRNLARLAQGQAPPPPRLVPAASRVRGDEPELGLARPGV